VYLALIQAPPNANSSIRINSIEEIYFVVEQLPIDYSPFTIAHSQFTPWAYGIKKSPVLTGDFIDGYIMLRFLSH